MARKLDMPIIFVCDKKGKAVTKFADNYFSQIDMDSKTEIPYQ